MMFFNCKKFSTLPVFLLFCLFFQVKIESVSATPVSVVFLTHSGSTVLKSWTAEEISKFAGKNKSVIPSQKFIFDISAEALALNDRASIDLMTITTPEKIIRVPRFLVWRGYFQFQWDAQKKILNSRVKKIDPGSLIVPISYFDAKNIQKIELSEHTLIYPQTKLRLRTNPAASRGEKLFTQSCLACHSTSTLGAKNLSPLGLTHESLKNFSSQHKKVGVLNLDARSERGIVAYSEALAL